MTATPTKTRKSIEGVVTTTYTYDHTGQRIKKANNTTTLYPFSNYEIKDNKVTKHIYLNNTFVYSSVLL